MAEVLILMLNITGREAMDLGLDIILDSTKMQISRRNKFLDKLTLTFLNLLSLTEDQSHTTNTLTDFCNV